MKNIRLKFTDIKEEEPIFIKEGGWFFQWCCNCKLRHIWRFHIVKSGRKQYIRIEMIADRNGTALRRWYEKHKNKKKGR